jgi:glycosyltransferase involved in cell wall biosynthesis
MKRLAIPEFNKLIKSLTSRLINVHLIYKFTLKVSFIGYYVMMKGYREGREIGLMIPAFNEEKSIQSVLTEARKNFPKAHIVVIDDGSSDNTSKVSRISNSKTLKLVNNLGVCNAIKIGFEYFDQLRLDVIVVMDADGQHNPREIEKLITTLNNQNCDIVIGIRDSKIYSFSLIEKAGISLIKLILRARYNLHLQDPTSGMRAFRRSSCIDAIRKISDDFLDDTAGLASLSKLMGLSIKEVKVEMNPRYSGKSSHNYLSKLMRTLGLSTRLVVGRNL